MSNSGSCFNCGAELSFELGTNVGRRDECDSCGHDVRVCRNCSFFDEKAYNQCGEPQADRVVDKTKANFCDYFRLGTAAKSSADSARSDALKKLDDLFK